MNVTKLAPYAKTAVAVLGALLATASVCIDGKVTNEDLMTIIVAWGTVFGVYQIPNSKG